MERVDESILAGISDFDSATIYNAIEKVQGISNEDYTGPEMEYLSPEFGVVVGYAVTSEVTPLDPTPSDIGWDQYYDLIHDTPGPKVAVMKDVDVRPNRGAIFGDGMARIHKALGVKGAVVDGCIRDLGGIIEAGLPIWGLGTVSGHGPFFVRRMAEPVVIGQICISHGDLLFADQDGVVNIPKDIAGDVLRVAGEIRTWERSYFDMVEAPDFTYEKYKIWVSKNKKNK
jgi:regulator of RNase E activity RraA